MNLAQLKFSIAPQAALEAAIAGNMTYAQHRRVTDSVMELETLLADYQRLALKHKGRDQANASNLRATQNSYINAKMPLIQTCKIKLSAAQPEHEANQPVQGWGRSS